MVKWGWCRHGRFCGEQRKAEYLGCLNKKFIFYQLLARSLVANEELMTSWGRMNQGLRETGCCLPTAVSQGVNKMQCSRAWVLDQSWNPNCPQVSGGKFFDS